MTDTTQPLAKEGQFLKVLYEVCGELKIIKGNVLTCDNSFLTVKGEYSTVTIPVRAIGQISRTEKRI